jgi:hypothetical protein
LLAHGLAQFSFPVGCVFATLLRATYSQVTGAEEGSRGGAQASSNRHGFGADSMDLAGNVVMDSYICFLKGMLLAIGLIYWSSIPDIERHVARGAQRSASI